MIAQHHLGECLVAGNDEPARVAARVLLTAELEIANDVMVKEREAAALLHEVEYDVRIVTGESTPDYTEIAADADAARIVPEALQRSHDIVFGFSELRGPPFQLRSWPIRYQTLIGQHENT
jgi:hypothetical protein